MRVPKIYLAGPDVFLPDPLERGAHLKALCRRHGAEGLFPMDNEIAGSGKVAERIRTANLRMIRDCDAVVANMAPFRGPAMDGGTAYEMGYAAALGRIVVGYQDRDVPPFHERVVAACGTGEAIGPCGIRDGAGFLVESFPDENGRPLHLADNLMMACGLDGFAFTAEQAVLRAVALLRTRGWPSS